MTVEQTRAELKAIGAKLASDFPDTNKDLAPYAEPFSQRIVGPQLRALVFTGPKLNGAAYKPFELDLLAYRDDWKRLVAPVDEDAQSISRRISKPVETPHDNRTDSAGENVCL